MRIDSIRTSPMRTDLIRISPMWTDLVRTSPMRTNSVRTDSIWTSPMRTHSIRANPIRFTSIRADPIRSDSIWTDPIRFRPIPGRSNSIQVYSVRLDSNRFNLVWFNSAQFDSDRCDSIEFRSKIPNYSSTQTMPAPSTKKYYRKESFNRVQAESNRKYASGHVHARQRRTRMNERNNYVNEHERVYVYRGAERPGGCTISGNYFCRCSGAPY